MTHWQENGSIIESMYPGIAQAIRDVEPVAASETQDWTAHANRELDAHWSEDIDLFIVYRFTIGPLAKQLFDKINLCEAGDLRGRRMLLMDDDPQRFRWGLEHQDWTTLLNSDRCLFHLPDPGFHQLNRLIGKYRHMTQVNYALLNADPDAPEQSLAIIRERFEITKHDTKQRIDAAVNQLKQIKAPPFPKTVRFFVPGHNMLQDACVKSMKAMGYGVERLQWQKPLYRFIRPYAWLNPVLQDEIDTAFFLNATPKTFCQHDLFNDLPLKAASWFVDNPRRYVNSPDDFCGCDAVGVFDSTYIPYVKALTDAPVVEARTAHSIDYTLAAVDGEFSKIKVAFVGELGANGFLPYEKAFALTQPERLKQVNELLRQHDVSDLTDWTPLAEQLFNEHGEAYFGSWVECLENKATAVRRRYFLEAARPFGLTIFGADDWAMPEFAGALTNDYAGRRIDYHTELPRLYASAKINLNLFHTQCMNGLNPRVYDVLACGGFLLTQYNPGVEDEFAIGRDLDVFHTRDEMVEKIAYYLDRPDERAQIAQSGQVCALAKYGYRVRIQALLNALRSVAGESYGYICG